MSPEEYELPDPHGAVAPGEYEEIWTRQMRMRIVAVGKKPQSYQLQYLELFFPEHGAPVYKVSQVTPAAKLMWDLWCALCNVPHTVNGNLIINCRAGEEP